MVYDTVNTVQFLNNLKHDIYVDLNSHLTQRTAFFSLTGFTAFVEFREESDCFPYETLTDLPPKQTTNVSSERWQLDPQISLRKPSFSN